MGLVIWVAPLLDLYAGNTGPDSGLKLATHSPYYRQVSNIRRIKSIATRCLVENEDVVGAAPTGDASTTSELSTILLPTKVLLY